MKKLLLLLLLVLPSLLSADVDVKDGFSNMDTFDGFTNVGKLDGFVFASGATGPGGTPTYASGTYSTGTNNDLSYAQTNITPTSGSDRCFVAFVSSYATGGAAINAVYWDYNAVGEYNFIGNVIDTTSAFGGDINAGMYYYCTDIGTSPLTVRVNVSTAAEVAITIAQFNGCNTTSLINDTGTASEDSGEDPNRITTSVTTTINNTLLVSGVMSTGDNLETHTVCDSTGQTLLTDVYSGNVQTLNMGYFDMSTAGVKSQCFQSTEPWYVQVAITGALKPTGS